MGKRPRALTAVEKKWLDRNDIARRLFQKMRQEKEYMEDIGPVPRVRLAFAKRGQRKEEMITLDGTHFSRSVLYPLCRQGLAALLGVEGPAVSPRAFYPNRKPKQYVAFVAQDGTMLSVAGLSHDVGEVYILRLAEELLLLTHGGRFGLLARSGNKYASDDTEYL